MGVLVAGRKANLSEPGVVQLGDVYVWSYEAQGIRSYDLENLSGQVLLVRYVGGQPNSSAQYNNRVGAYEAITFPVADENGPGVGVVYVFSTSNAAEFLFSAFSHVLDVARKANPATVPTAAAVKIEDATVAGQLADVSAGGALSVEGVVTVGGTTSITPGTAAENLGKAEDAAHGSGDVGVMALGVRNDSQVALAGAEGDYSPVSLDSIGRVMAQIQDANPAAANLLKKEDAAHVSGDAGVMALGVRNDADAARSSADGDYTPLNVDASGKLKISSIQSIASSVTPGTASGNLGKAEDAAHTSGDTGVMALGVRNDTNAARSGTDGDYTPIAVDSIGRTITRPSNGALTDRSLALTLGGTAQNAAGANQDRKFLEIANPDSDIGSGGESIWYSLVGAAAPNGQGSIELVPGGVARYDGSFVPTSAVSVVAATTGHKIYCAEA